MRKSPTTAARAAAIAPYPHQLDPERFRPEVRRRLSAPAVRTFLAIADLWGLSTEERLIVLGFPAPSTYHQWVKTAREHGDITLPADTLLRISAVLGIHQALGVLFLVEQDGVDWLRTPHEAPVFGGRPPLTLLLAGTQDAMLSVRRFLDAARGGLYMAPNEADADAAPYTDADVVFS
ncbi:MAG TPA: MbcA/ParS/Xre antitoxin family protein [Acetobacteraceae bacterium]|jgi:hypothetical protein|nr:MbcA/ParS/Xre antitoxin family protein [Acetobacteraceae bacterium]